MLAVSGVGCVRQCQKQSDMLGMQKTGHSEATAHAHVTLAGGLNCDPPGSSCQRASECPTARE